MSPNSNATHTRQAPIDDEPAQQVIEPNSNLVDPTVEVRDQPLPIPEVSELAYEKYLARGEKHGFDVQDWLEAEGEIVARPRH